MIYERHAINFISESSKNKIDSFMRILTGTGMLATYSGQVFTNNQLVDLITEIRAVSNINSSRLSLELAYTAKCVRTCMHATNQSMNRINVFIELDTRKQ